MKNKISLNLEKNDNHQEIEIIIDEIKLKMIEESLNHFIYSSIFDDVRNDYKNIMIDFHQDILIISKMIESNINLLDNEDEENEK